MHCQLFVMFYYLNELPKKLEAIMFSYCKIQQNSTILVNNAIEVSQK